MQVQILKRQLFTLFLSKLILLYITCKCHSRQEQQRKQDKLEDFVCYSDSDSEEETPAQQHKILSTSYNFVDYVRSREIQAAEVHINISHS